MIYADVTLEQLNISSHPLPLEMDGGSILIWSPPSHNWAVSCSVDAAQGWAGLRLLPGVAQQLAACPCTGDVSVRGDTWVSWGHCIMSKQCHNTGHCYDGKYGHVTCSIWSQGRTPGSPRPSHTWHQHTTHEMTHDSSTHQLECKLRLPSNTMISFPNDHHQYTTYYAILFLCWGKGNEKSGGDKHIMILCNIWCTLCSLLNLINCMTGEHDWQSLDRGKLRREKPLTVQHIITNSGVVHCIVCECVTSLSRHCPRPDRVVHSEDGWDRPPAPESSLLSCVAVAAGLQTTYFSADISQ